GQEPSVFGAHLNPRGDLHDAIGPPAAVPVRPLAVRPSLRPEMPLPLEVDEGAQAFVHLKDDASPVASVASIRPAGWHVLLAPEADGAVPSVAPLRHDFRPVDKHAAPPDTKAPDPEPAGIQ